jgi:hypothetical protein
MTIPNSINKRYKTVIKADNDHSTVILNKTIGIISFIALSLKKTIKVLLPAYQGYLT